MSLNSLCLGSMTHASNHPDYLCFFSGTCLDSLHSDKASCPGSCIPKPTAVLALLIATALPLSLLLNSFICSALEHLRQLSVHHLSPTPADRRSLNHAVIRIYHTHLVCLTRFGSNTLAIVIKRRINARPAVFFPHLRFDFILPGPKRRRISIAKTVPITSAQLGPF